MVSQVTIVEGKKGHPTIQVEIDGNIQLIHSKYDPIREANLLLDHSLEQIEETEHIFFYGIGLGYHVIQFAERFPEKLISIYEPNAQVNALRNKYAVETKFNTLPIRDVIVETEKEIGRQALQKFANELTHKVTLIIHPVYERLFPKETQQFVKDFKEFVVERKLNIDTGIVFGSRWTTNAIMNLIDTLQTPNFILDYKEEFRDKPVVLVAAGPSLSEEIENLKKIKEKGLAYIFAVGSANKELIAKNIKPDAVFSYDPQQHNFRVFEPILEGKYEDIPLVYGTSVGNETVSYWPGPKMHFVTSQDKLTQSFTTRKLPVINDAYSVAIVTMQILFEMNVSEIVLVGQNFAFKNDLFYADSIVRFDRKKGRKTDATIQDRDIENAFFVEAADGGQVQTNDNFNRMRLSMENYLEQVNCIPVINTTKGGAKIEGTEFKTLDVVIAGWTERVVQPNWYEKKVYQQGDNWETEQLRHLARELNNFPKQLQDALDYFMTLEQRNYKTERQIQRELDKIDKVMKQLLEAELFTKLICNRLTDDFKKVQVETNVIQLMNNSKEKVLRIQKLFTIFWDKIRNVMNELAPLLETYIINPLNNDFDVYVAASGFVHYEGTWEKYFYPQDIIPENQSDEERKAWQQLFKQIGRVVPPTTSIRTNEKGAKATFELTNGTFQLYGRNLSSHAIILRITVGERTKQVVLKKENVIKENYQSSVCFFTHKQLIGEERTPVTIEMMDNGTFQFDSVHISKGTRVWHVDEVADIGELEVGKKIRCHYKTNYNRVGNYKNFEESSRREFIPLESKANPDGDFYYIAVANESKKLKLIADRNIQVYISYEKLIECENDLLTGHDTFEVEEYSDWDKYITNDFHWNNLNVNSWTKSVPELQDLESNHNYRIARGRYSNSYSTYADINKKFLKCGFRPKICIVKE